MSLQGMLSQRLELIGAIALKGFGAAEGINVNETLNQLVHIYLRSVLEGLVSRKGFHYEVQTPGRQGGNCS